MSDKLKTLTVLLEQIKDNAEAALPRIKRPSMAGIEVELVIYKAKAAIKAIKDMT